MESSLSEKRIEVRIDLVINFPRSFCPLISFYSYTPPTPPSSISTQMKGLEVLLILKHGSPTPILIASVLSTSAILGCRWWGFECGRWGACRWCCGIRTLPTFPGSALGPWEWVVVAVDGQHDSNFFFRFSLLFSETCFQLQDRMSPVLLFWGIFKEKMINEGNHTEVD